MLRDMRQERARAIVGKLVGLLALIVAAGLATITLWFLYVFSGIGR